MPDTPRPREDHRSPRLEWGEDGAPRSGRFGDVYFSREDGLAETRTVFLDGCGLPEAWAGRSRFVVGELGFGTGLNIAALIDLWRRTAEPDARLHVFTVEGYPLTRAEAARALAAWPELHDVSEALLAVWPEGTPGFHRLDLPAFSVTIDLAVGEVEWALAQWDGRADAWFLDGFAPSANPGMWSDAVLAHIAERSAPDARLATFTVAGAVRRGLAAQGFVVEKKPGHGRKRERLEARLNGASQTVQPPRVAVVGAGIACAAVVRALRALGLAPVLIEAEQPGAGASGFPASLVTPRLDAGDTVIAALGAQALTRAGQLYRSIPGAVLAEGVLQLAQAARDPARFARIATQPVWPEGAMTALDAAACSERLGETVTDDGLLMRDALAVSGARVLAAWLDGAERLNARVARIGQDGARLRLTREDGAEITTADAVVLAAGWGVQALAPRLALAPVRGQADWTEEQATTPPAAWGGYAIPTPSGVLFGATHERGETEAVVSQAASAKNLATLNARLPGLASRLATSAMNARAAIRATTPDRLPLAGRIAPGLFVLGGLGSRGFSLAPLLGEHVAALAADAASPLPRELAQRLRPDRFVPLA